MEREKPLRGSRVDTLQKIFYGDPASRMKIHLDAQDSGSSEGSGPATRPHRKNKEKTPEGPPRPAERHPHYTGSFATCSDGDSPKNIYLLSMTIATQSPRGSVCNT